MKYCALFLCFAVGVCAEILPTDRQYAWTGNVGVSGGIPSVTTIYTTLTPSGGNDTTQIQNALNACPSNQVVKLGAGNFVLASRLDYASSHDGVVLRGSGTNSTTLRFDGGALGCFLVRSLFDNNTLGHGTNVSATVTKGDTNILLVGMPSYVKVGHLYLIDQVDDSSFVQAGTDAIFETGNDYRYNNTTTAFGHRGMSQIIKVKGISGNTVQTEMPLTYAFSTTQTARLWKTTYDSATESPLRRCGFEDFRVVGNFTDSTCHMFYFENTDECWIKNVWSDTVPGLCHVQTFYSYRGTIRDSMFRDAKSFGAGQGYGVGLYNGTTGWLIENNSFQRLHLAMSVNYGATANVFGYNNELEGQDDGANKSIVGVSGHGSHTSFNLFEGNWMANHFNFDVVHGSSSHNVVFRNRCFGTNNINDGESAINLDYYNRLYSVIGNILGASEHTIYEKQASATCSSTTDKVIWKIGYKNGYGCSSGCDGGGNCFDSSVVNDVLRAVNYDTVTSTNGGLVLGGYGTSDLVSSYYLASKPSFQGALPWPPIDPASPSTASITNIAAGYLYTFGTNPPTSFASGGGGGSVETTITAGRVTVGTFFER